LGGKKGGGGGRASLHFPVARVTQKKGKELANRGQHDTGQGKGEEQMVTSPLAFTE